ncbi:VOC family protein [Natronosporangium hydrolyticum]|uniref:VOC family protein n=1 Tax=Natronosporangium hydrolyticum TaxID=2811111 RepID=A0A895YI68_9ACTN|nr:VOC family protein [Natronosporangium hydrolyticum]QSB13448.1 VOC family protein [Natronosporangium hydrolyticum]
MRIRGYAPATPCWAELTSSDPAASIAFYSGLFGWRTTETEVGSTVFTLRDLAAAGIVPTLTDGQPSAWLSYISTEEIDATVEQVGNAGGTILQPATEIGGRGTMAMLADPAGATFGLWQRGTFGGAQVATEANAVCWTDLAVRDVPGAAAFYGKVFGWRDEEGSLPTGYDYREWWVNNRVVAGVTIIGDEWPAEVPAHWRTTIEVDDCAATAARCRDLGGQVVLGPIDVNVGTYAQLIDPLGASFGIISLIPDLRLTP